MTNDGQILDGASDDINVGETTGLHPRLTADRTGGNLNISHAPNVLMNGFRLLASGATTISDTDSEFKVTDGDTSRIIDVEGKLSGIFTGLLEGAFIGPFGTSTLFITYGRGNDIDIVLFIPEPTTLLMTVLITWVLSRQRHRTGKNVIHCYNSRYALTCQGLDPNLSHERWTQSCDPVPVACRRSPPCNAVALGSIDNLGS